MATLEQNVLINYKDTNGNRTIAYPITNVDCVDGLEEAIQTINDTIDAKKIDFSLENETLTITVK